nr:hypothetical protein [Tanacetum cinerariifolium]
MSTQQDIYVAGSENRPPMLNKDNYVPWSSRIIRYARSRPNGKMIVDSIENGSYVRRMIATPGEPDLPVPVPESFHKQTDKELTENDIKRMDADDQAIQTILLGLLEDVYATVDSCEIAKEIWERVRQMMKGSDIREHERKAKPSMNEKISRLRTGNRSNLIIIVSYINDPTEAMNAALILFAKAFQLTAPTNNNQRTSSNPRNRSITKPSINMSQDRQIQNNSWIQVAQNAVQNAGVQSGGNQNGLVVKPRIANQNGTGNVVAARAKGDLDKIEEVNANCILMVNLQHASTSGTQLDKALVYDTDSSAEYTDLLEPILKPQLVPQNDNHVTFVAPSMVQSEVTVETSSAPNEETRAHQETIYRNLVNQVAQ